MSVTHEIRKILWKIGYDLSRFTPETHSLARRKQLLAHYGIDVVLDIGANSGHFARQLREDIAYSGPILSFEPLQAAFALLEKNSKRDPNWKAFNYAMGDSVGEEEINVSQNSLSSSIMDILPSHVDAAPQSKYVGKQMIEIKTLDSVFDELCGSYKNIYMKIDTQGFESKVLSGASQSLAKIDTIQMELSLVPLYSGELLFDEMCLLMRKKGYSLIGIENGFTDLGSGQLLQVDGIFRRL